MSNPFAQSQDDDYNPFSAPPKANAYTSPGNYTEAPSYTAPAPAPTVSVTQTVGQTFSKINEAVTSNAAFQLTEEDIEKRERALREKEELIARREQQLADARANGTMDSLVYHPKNFPPLIKMWAYYPQDDLPEPSRKMVSRIFWVFCTAALALLLNFVGVIILLFTDVRTNLGSPATVIVMSLVYLVLLVPISFEVSFFVLYSALQAGKAVKYFCFLLTYFIFFCMHCVFAIGFDDGGSIGFIRMFSIWSVVPWCGAISLIYCIVEVLVCIGIFFTFLEAFRYYKNTGLDKATMGEVSKLAADYAVDNKDVIITAAKENPEFAMSVAQAAAKSQV